MTVNVQVRIRVQGFVPWKGSRYGCSQGSIPDPIDHRPDPQLNLKGTRKIIFPVRFCLEKKIFIPKLCMLI